MYTDTDYGLYMYKKAFIAVEENADLFQKKELLPPEDLDEKAHSYSRLSDLLESSMSMGENPFLEYAKFDGKVNVYWMETLSSWVYDQVRLKQACSTTVTSSNSWNFGFSKYRYHTI